MKRTLTLIFVLFAGKACFGATDPAAGHELRPVSR